jgi:glyoxylase-like metal-dependent hydrolase (beta-lactamase superfamily II)
MNEYSVILRRKRIVLTQSKGIKGKIQKIPVPTPFPVGDVNLYLLIDDAVTLVDAGPNTEEAWTVLKRELSGHGLTVQDIDQIILTHHHPDHCGMAGKLQEASGATFYCHDLSRPFVLLDDHFLDQQAQWFAQFYAQHGVPEVLVSKADYFRRKHSRHGDPVTITGTLREGDRLPGHNNWEIYHMPGHAQDQLCFYHREQELLLASDHVLKHISSNALLEAPHKVGEERPRSLYQYRESLTRLLSLPIRKALPGHGESITEIVELINHRLERTEHRMGVIRELLHQQPKSVYEIGEAMFKEKATTEMPLVFSEIIGHLDLLEMEGHVNPEQKGDKIIYKKG